MRWLKNWIGSRLGYSACPNCDDNWWWKPLGNGIWYNDNDGLLLCAECDLGPVKVNRVLEVLFGDWEWPSDKLRMVREALKRHNAQEWKLG